MTQNRNRGPWFNPSDRRFHQGTAAIVLIVILAGFVIDYFLVRNINHDEKGTVDDATIFISTLILIYTVFLSVYGLLLPMLTKELRTTSRVDNPNPETNRRPWTWLALILIIIAVLVDLWRIENSLDDLYIATTKRLKASELADAHVEFVFIWFLANVVVVILTFIVLYVRTTRARSDGNRRLCDN